ncbi:MAG: sensor histidine kinase, partial [Acidimicrobiia bacterium]
GRGSTADANTDAGSGRGIAGMRERARSLGGELEAGPRPGGGFRVRARLPVNGAP